MFKSIEATNFLSWKKLEFTILDGITLIEGHNFDDNTPEGAGKSTIANALCWALYGKIPKDSKIDDVIRDGAKSCTVKVELEGSPISYSVVRSRKPNDLFILQNGVSIRGKDAKETQKMIETMLGMGFNTFVQSVYFAQNYNKKFITANEEDRVKILSEILDIKVFDRAREAARKQLKATIKEYEALQQTMSADASKVVLMQEKIAEFKEIKKAKFVELKNSIKQKEEELKLYKKEATNKDISKINSAIEGVSKTFNGVLAEVAKLSEQLNNLQNTERARVSADSRLQQKLQIFQKTNTELGAALKMPGTKCRECGSVLDKEAKYKYIQKLKNNLEQYKNEIKELKEDLDQIPRVDKSEIEIQLKDRQSCITKLREEKQILEKQLFSWNRSQSRVELLEAELISLDANLKGQENNSEIDAMIARSKDTIKTIQAILTTSQIKLKALADLSDQFRTLTGGFKEIKSYVFQGVLKELTYKVNNYLQQLFEMPLYSHFTNEETDGSVTKINIDITVGGIKRPLGLYSGGQFRRIQLAVDLALSDIVASRNHCPISLRILDEAMKDLSEPSMEKVLHLLEQKKGSTILIEHNSIFRSIVDQVFEVELKDGISQKA